MSKFLGILLTSISLIKTLFEFIIAALPNEISLKFYSVNKLLSVDSHKFKFGSDKLNYFEWITLAKFKFYPTRIILSLSFSNCVTSGFI